ncbi:hypothetical protein B0H14DRAFT_3499209 [Mycena olivaceomarginata]|nr:hypothetical protein B0H14DRAFT_3499209 [Mycena olivaceomarginata]
MDGVCKVLDGVDLVAVTPTGSGKTAYLFLSILVMMAISKTPSLCPAVKFPKDPAIVVVCPTNSIEQQLDENMAKLGVPALTINSNTMASARICKEDLWIKARAGIAMLILGPEQLISQGFRDLLAFEPFYNRVCTLEVDEIHLLVYWGQIFRKAFAQIGFMRSRLRPGIPIIGLTASLLADPKFLFRRLYSGIDGRLFPEVAWVLDTDEKILMFGSSISLVHSLRSYLNSLLPIESDRDIRIRTHTGFNWPDDKLRTLADIGNDIKVIKTVIQIGEPERVEMYVQKPGRARPCIKNPRAIFYISANRMELAAKIVQQTDAENAADATKAGSSVPKQDRQFDNPPTDSPCPCTSCTNSPPAPRPDNCRCSGCMPETATHELYTPAPKKKKQSSASDIPQGKKLTKIMKEAARSRLEEFRLSVWLEASDRSMGLTPLVEFLPDMVIDQLLDRFAKITTLADLIPFVSRISGLEGYHGQLFDVLVALRAPLSKLKKARAKK